MHTRIRVLLLYASIAGTLRRCAPWSTMLWPAVLSS